MRRTFYFQAMTIRIPATSLNQAKNIAKKIGSKTAFIGIDIWVVKDGKVYTLPPESFETKITKNTLPENIELEINIDTAEIKIPREVIKPTTKTDTPTPLIGGHWYEWRTIRQHPYNNVIIPVLILNNNARSSVFGTVGIAS